MKVTDRTRGILAARKERRDLLNQGWRQINEFSRFPIPEEFCRWKFTDVRISVTGQYLWVKIEDEDATRA